MNKKKIDRGLEELMRADFVEKYITIREIARRYHINENTLYSLATRKKWKEQRELALSDVGIAHKVKNTLNELLTKLSVEDLKDGKTADTISKINKLLKDLNPEKDTLGYLLAFGHDLITFAKLKEDPIFMDKLEEYLSEFSEYVKEKYVKN